MKKMFHPTVKKAKMKYFLVGFGRSYVKLFHLVGKDGTCSGNAKQTVILVCLKVVGNKIIKMHVFVFFLFNL